MVSHGVVVFGMFYIVDVVADRTKTGTLASLGGIRNVAPTLATVFVIVMLGSVALPLTSGFVGEFLLINSIFQYQFILGAVAGLTIILGAVYMLRTFQKSMSGEVNNLTARFADLSTEEKWVLYPVVALILIIGIYPTPILELSEPAVANLLKVYSNLSASVK
jgi:NADH-quinone oxidoreductase subunit M